MDGIYSDAVWGWFEGEPSEEKPLISCAGCGAELYRGDKAVRMEDGYIYCADCALSPVEELVSDDGDDWDAVDEICRAIREETEQWE